MRPHLALAAVVLATLAAGPSLALNLQGSAWARRSRNWDATTYGFYIHAFDEGKAVVEQLRSLRRHYAAAPVYVMSDGGMNYSGICEAVGHCEFHWRPPAHGKWNPKPFLDRFRDAAERLGTDYVVLLEPGVTIHRPIRWRPRADAAGPENGDAAPLRPELVDFVEQLGRWASGNLTFRMPWTRFGIAGGTAVRAGAAVEAFRPDDLDWDALEMLGTDKVYAGHAAMALALAARGFEYAPWEEVSDSDGSMGEAADRVAFRVGPYEPTSMSTEEWALVDGPPQNTGGVSCRGCVWDGEENCWPRAGGRIQCPMKVSLLSVEEKAFRMVPLGIDMVPAQPLTAHDDQLVGEWGSSSLLVGILMLHDPFKKNIMGAQDLYPEWIPRLLGRLKENLEAHGHSLVVRRSLHAGVPPYMLAACPILEPFKGTSNVNASWTRRVSLLQLDAELEKGPGSAANSPKFGEEEWCKGAFRENTNWEKYAMLSDYLRAEDPGRPHVSHMMMLDLDATFPRPDRDTLKHMADHMDEIEADVVLADEDWTGPHRSGPLFTNGGMVMMKNTEYARNFLDHFNRAHQYPKESKWNCWSNEQLCMRGFLAEKKPGVPPCSCDDPTNRTSRTRHIQVLSGMQYNRHPCALDRKPGARCKNPSAVPYLGVNKSTYIVHYMGGSKGAALQTKWEDVP